MHGLSIAVKHIKPLSTSKNSKAGLVDPAYRFGTGSVDLISIHRPSMSKLLKLLLSPYVFSPTSACFFTHPVASRGHRPAARGFLLHHHRQVLEFMHQDRQGASRHFDPAGGVKRRLGRNPIATAHQEHLE